MCEMVCVYRNHHLKKFSYIFLIKQVHCIFYNLQGPWGNIRSGLPQRINYLRRGHKSGGPQQRFDAHPDLLVVKVLIEQDQLIE